MSKWRPNRPNGGNLFYKHWKKIALALTGFFWAGCEDSASEAVCLYGPDPNYSSATENPVSSSSTDDATTSSSSAPSTSSGTEEESSSNELMQMALDYGVPYYLDDRDTVLTLKTLCFNDSVQNTEGRVFKIIDCIDGNKYLRDPSVAGAEGVELPEGVQVFAPKAGSDKAPNCTENGDVCIERNPNISEELDSLAGCHPIIDCPEKSDATYIKVD
ncbi:hypothetical protein [Fibrobacter sp. UWH4]|uniref:hypothetical protein n=1 Tax=Fibrobacter sp. UWH4 TaxID=1896210 RepID=UPI000916D0D8|nr:hypothetical protein [Fibrobacter sp. UWH4]SHK82087.1 hypothetical protein SAMN05720762_103137 [Fibrobacter sp. UWH4]